MAIREDILTAVYEADRLHEQYRTRERAEKGEGRIDVFGMLFGRDIPTLFRPLTGLLGAYVDNPSEGILVTSRRRLPIQRFTAAHELGHCVLGHNASFDGNEILARSMFGPSGGGDPREIQANAFATELLTPRWLVVHHMKQQSWQPQDFYDPKVVYQLSLRIGSSYQATCYALAEFKILDATSRDRLLQVERRTIKKELAAPYVPDNWYGDVWLLTERDQGAFLEGGWNDLIVFQLTEHSTSGYAWKLGELAESGFLLQHDEYVSPGNNGIGGLVFRYVIAESQAATTAHICLKELRPWQDQAQPLNSLEFDVDFSGPIRDGLHPRQITAMLNAA